MAEVEIVDKRTGIPVFVEAADVTVTYSTRGVTEARVVVAHIQADIPPNGWLVECFERERDAMGYRLRTKFVTDGLDGAHELALAHAYIMASQLSVARIARRGAANNVVEFVRKLAGSQDNAAAELPTVAE